VAATAQEAQLDAKKLCPSPCPLQSRGGYPSWPTAQLPVHEERRISAEQPQPTAAHCTITTARRPDHIRLSALVRSRSTQFTAHPSCELGRGPPKRGHFSAILAGFFHIYICIYMYVCMYICVYICIYIYIHIYACVFIYIRGRVTSLSKLLVERKSQHREENRTNPRALLHDQAMNSDK